MAVPVSDEEEIAAEGVIAEEASAEAQPAQSVENAQPENE
jgi:hypothetical protein